MGSELGACPGLVSGESRGEKVPPGRVTDLWTMRDDPRFGVRILK